MKAGKCDQCARARARARACVCVCVCVCVGELGDAEVKFLAKQKSSSWRRGRQKSSFWANVSACLDHLRDMFSNQNYILLGVFRRFGPPNGGSRRSVGVNFGDS